jgi:hypothetical protein
LCVERSRIVLNERLGPVGPLQGVIPEALLADS